MEEAGVMPLRLRMLEISMMESRPMFEGAEWWAADGVWFEETWWADARPLTLSVKSRCEKDVCTYEDDDIE